MDKFLSMRDVEKEYGIPVRSLRKWRSERTGPTHYKLGGHVRYRREDLEAWFAACRQEALPWSERLRSEGERELQQA